MDDMGTPRCPLEPADASGRKLCKSSVQQRVACGARTLGSLVRAILYTLGLAQQAFGYADWSVAMARCIGDPAVLAFSLM